MKLLQQLKKLTQDNNIELETVTYGSTNLYIKISEESSDKLKKSILSGDFKKKTKFEPKSFKQYLFSKSDFPISFEFSRYFPSSDNDIKSVYDCIKFNQEYKVGEFWNFKEPELKMTCVMFASYREDFEFLSANGVRIIDTTTSVSKKRKHFIQALDFVRNESINHPIANWTSLSTFKREVKHDNIPIFKSRLDRIHEAFYKLLGVLVELDDKNIYSTITKLDEKFSGAEGYVIIRLDSRRSEFKKADKLIIDRLIKVEDEEEDESNNLINAE
ncbi:MAG: hypothetical protein IPM91_16055 [Bacteroidetes bacterium]|nr:hypothetical protein [Bacteroidota bacterium]